ncbi:FomB family phosphonate monophosphate kinase [Micromonospora sp. WMMD1120]|uniref:FomB family phosphonate monophosphate kinase n=1 Tax=Micromonospora sp. WMMD1120 TaxID=3016106 RepID=UPI002416A206|nr:FomB family phosphonate monophosphate kinase [Micromonospora sp. WMMD1120]MDG4807563.1 FomB family phosphonate monophosphate kinase [Micromonospora sp. WMMD1120]
MSAGTPGGSAGTASRSTDGTPIRFSTVVDLNLFRVRLSSNVEDFSATSYFTRFGPDVPGATADFEVRCIDLARDRIDESVVRDQIDDTVRAKRMARGYYRGPYFGAPAYLVTRGRTFSVYGTSLERLVWPYFVKYLLCVYAAGEGYADLKAGGFASPEGGATLLFGQSGGGKTVFLTQACLGGARFLTNTHTLLRDGVAHAVPSAIRVRADDVFRATIARLRLPRHLEQGEYIARPEQLFPAPPVDAAPVRNIVIMGRRSAGAPALERVSSSTATAFLDQFGMGVTTYGLKDDLISHFAHDIDAFAEHYGRMKKAIAEMCEGSRCYVSRVDMTDVAIRRAVLEQLSA